MTPEREKEIRNADWWTFTQREWEDISIDLLAEIDALKAEKTSLLDQCNKIQTLIVLERDQLKTTLEREYDRYACREI